MSREHPHVAAFVAALRSPDLGVEADWRDLADVLWLATSSVSPRTDAGLEPGDGADNGTPHDDQVREAVEPAPVTDAGGPLPTPTTDTETAEGWRLSDEVAGDGTGLAVDVPPWLAIPGRAEIGRALRPLKRRRPSKRRRVLDPEATVDAFCESGVIVPVLRPARERWLQVSVVADASPTMSVWRDTVAALVDLLERHGAFRAVTRWTLDERPDGAVLTDLFGVEHEPRVLADEAGRRLVLVVTDAVGDLWRREAAWSAVRLWGSTGPVALVHLLPDRMWGQTATGEADVAVRSQRAGEANARLDVRAPWWWNEDRPPWGAVPVLTLDEASIAPWARLVSGVHGVAVRAVLGVVPEDFPDEVAPEDTLPELLGDAIRSSVSSTAYRLAALLSAVDVSLPVARVVMAQLLPEARQVHLGELLAAGVLRSTDDGEDTALEFAPGVRALVQETLTSSDVLRTWRAVTPLLTASGRTPQFSLLLTEGAEALGGEPDPMARIAADLARRLGLIGPMPAPGGRQAAVHAPTQEATQALPLDFWSGRRLALMIATTTHRDPGLPSLQGAEAGLRALADVLGDPGIGGFTVEMLVDLEASELRRGLAAFLGAAGSNDVLLLYYSGHGILDADGRLYLAGVDTRVDALSATVLGASWLRRQMNECAARGVILILDCSFSGAFEGRASGIATGDALSQVLPEEPAARSERHVLTATGARQRAYDGGIQLTSDAMSLSPFTEAILHGLRTGDADRDGDGLVDVQEFYLYVRERMSHSSMRQTPELFSSATGHVFLARAGRSPSTGAAPFTTATQSSPQPDLDEALAAIEETVATYRQLAQTNPAAHLPDLATSLNNLSNRQADTGDREAALGSMTEAVDLYRELAETNRAAFLPDLAMSLNSLSNRQAEVGDRAEGLAAAQEAVDLYRELAAGNRDANLPDLAGSLSNLAIRLGEVGRREQALAPAQEAVDIRRRLAEAAPDAYLPDLAGSLSNLAIRLGEVGRREQALAPAQEAVDLRRELTGGNRDAYLPDLAMSVNNLAIRLAEAGRRAEAVALAREAAAHFRELARDDPSRYGSDIERTDALVASLIENDP